MTEQNSSESHVPEVWVSRNVSDTELTTALTQMYDILSSQIWVVPFDVDWMDSPNLDQYLIICTRRQIPTGEFPLYLHVVPLREQMLSTDGFEIAYKLAENLNCHALVWAGI